MPVSSRRLTDNPFHVLGLTSDATGPEIEAAARALLNALAAGDPGAARFDTPLGPRLRDTHAVRRALARLRDPDERIHHEIWAELAVGPGPQPLPANAEAAAGWPDAPRAMGWRAR